MAVHADLPDARRPSRSDVVWLAAILALGAALRLVGIREGIPFAIGVDEPQIVDRAVTIIKSGSFNPHFFDYPALFMYIEALVAAVRFLVGAKSGLWTNLSQVTAADFYLWARVVSAAFGVATIVVVYRTALRLGRFPALAAAALMAGQSLHVRESHYALTDVPMTFFVTLTLLLAVRASERPSLGAYFWAGVGAGLAAATKYNGGLVVLVPFLTVALAGSGRASRMAGMGAVAGGAALAFLLGAPFTVLDLPAFLNDFASLAHTYTTGARPVEPVWLTYVKHLRNSLGWPGLVVTLASLAVAALQAWRTSAPARVVWASVVAFSVAWFVLISRQQITFGRYLLPMLPMFAIATGGALGWLFEAGRRVVVQPLPRGAVVAVLLGLAAVPQAVTAARLDQLNRKESTTAQTYAWIMSHVPAGSKIALETRLLLLPDRYQSENEIDLIDHPYEYYASGGFEYVVAASQSYGSAFLTDRPPTPQATAYRNLTSRLELVQTFAPSADHPGAEFRIYRLVR